MEIKFATYVFDLLNKKKKNKKNKKKRCEIYLDLVLFWWKVQNF